MSPRPQSRTGAVDPLVSRYLAATTAPGAEPVEAATVRVRGVTRIGRCWLPFRSTETIAPRRWYVRRSRIAGLLRVDEGGHDGIGFRRTSIGRLVSEDDSSDAERHALVHRTLAAVRVPGCLAAGTGAVWARVDRDRLRVSAGDLELTLRVGPRGDLLGATTSGWGDPTGSGLPGWFPLGSEVRERRTFGATTVPAAVEVGWFPGSDRWSPVLRYRVVDWAPLAPLDPRTWMWEERR